MTAQANAKQEKAQAQNKDDAEFDKLYKPVGIAAVTAAAICNKGKKKAKS